MSCCHDYVIVNCVTLAIHGKIFLTKSGFSTYKIVYTWIRRGWISLALLLDLLSQNDSFKNTWIFFYITARHVCTLRLGMKFLSKAPEIETLQLASSVIPVLQSTISDKVIPSYFHGDNCLWVILHTYSLYVVTLQLNRSKDVEIKNFILMQTEYTFPILLSFRLLFVFLRKTLDKTSIGPTICSKLDKETRASTSNII
jgi:hypothetical protein